MTQDERVLCDFCGNAIGRYGSAITKGDFHCCWRCASGCLEICERQEQSAERGKETPEAEIEELMVCDKCGRTGDVYWVMASGKTIPMNVQGQVMEWPGLPDIRCADCLAIRNTLSGLIDEKCEGMQTEPACAVCGEQVGEHGKRGIFGRSGTALCRDCAA
jgi:hypothetical protein